MSKRSSKLMELSKMFHKIELDFDKLNNEKVDDFKYKPNCPKEM